MELPELLSQIGDMLDEKLSSAFAENNTKIYAEINKNNAELRAEINKNNAELRAEMNKNNAELRAEINKNNAELRAEMNKNSAELRSELHSEIRHLGVLIEKTEHNVQIIAEQYCDIMKTCASFSKVDDVENRVKTLETVVKNHSDDIADLKKAQ